MSLPKLIHAAVWIHLTEEKNIELILLKGHLLLESVIENSIQSLLKRGGQMLLICHFIKS